MKQDLKKRIGICAAAVAATLVLVIVLVLIIGKGTKDSIETTDSSEYSRTAERKTRAEVETTAETFNINVDINTEINVETEEVVSESEIQTEESVKESETTSKKQDEIVTAAQTEAVTTTASKPENAKETQQTTTKKAEETTKQTEEATTKKEIVAVTDVEKKAKAIVDEIISPSMSDFDKVLTIHNYMGVNYVRTDSNPNVTAEALFEAKEGNYDAYAEAFYLFAKFAGLEAEAFTGTTKNRYDVVIDYAWNQVKVDGIWYNIDVSRDDGFGEAYISYNYFLKSDAQFDEKYVADIPSTHTCPVEYDPITVLKAGMKTGIHGNSVLVTNNEEAIAAVNKFAEQGETLFFIWYYDSDIRFENQFEKWDEIKGSLDYVIDKCSVYPPAWGCAVYRLEAMSSDEFEATKVCTTAEQVFAYAREQYDSGKTSYSVRFEPADGKFDVFGSTADGYKGYLTLGYGGKFDCFNYKNGRYYIVTFNQN